MTLTPPAYVVIAMLMLGTGLIFWWHDRDNRATRALSLCICAIGLRLALSGPEFADGGPGRWFGALYALLEGAAILSGIEWGRRIGLTGTYAPRRWTMALFLAGQIVVLIFVIMRFVFELAWPSSAAADSEGLSRLTGLQWAIFAPVLLSGILCVGIAIAGLRLVRIDAAELVRLQALSLAGPFLLSALFLSEQLVPPALALGLLIFLWGSVRYLKLQGRRGQFMRQFLSPEVARMVQVEGMERTLQRERRVLSVVSCDLRGFTAYARDRDTDAVTGLLERYYELVGEIAERHGGTVKDHAGDGVLILVGAPVRYADHARRALALALDLAVEAHAMVQQESADLGLGVGVATGHLTIGAIRGAGRLEYVAVGNPVNLSARLCDRADGGRVLADKRTIDAMGLELPAELGLRERPPEPLKGFPEPIPVCEVFSGERPPRSRQDGRRRKRRRRLRVSIG